ncbi:MAG: hypothetical protein Q9187_006995 [Circinaria calcarea]
MSVQKEAGISRPSSPRRSTDLVTPGPPSPYNKLSSLPLRPRNRSPYARSHLRTRSSLSSLSAPPMARAHSSPVVDTSGQGHPPANARPPSPLLSSGRRQSPLRRPLDETYSSFGGQVDIDETISENSELEFTPRPTVDAEAMPSSPLSMHHTFPRSRRRPSSPLHHILQTQMHAGTSVLHTSASLPTLGSAAKFNEPYPSNYSISSSSMPSTPTSIRSRSPSISSLETIPDSPDAEEAAQEEDGIARLKAAADRESERELVRRRGSLDVPGRSSGGMVLGANGFGVVYGSRDKRKRWSVCGAERRGDLDLETIWED